jgi:sucrose-6-phosphate hydrolase SacC (GH32 family)
MTTISHNTDTTVYTIRDVSSQIDFFQDVEQTLTIYLEEKADLTYAIFLDSAKIKLTIIAQNPTVKAQIFAFLPSKQASDTSLQVCTKFQSSDTSVRMHLIAIQDDGAKLHMQGEIDIAS